MGGLVQQPQAAGADRQHPPVEFEMAYYRQMEESAKAAWLKLTSLRKTRGDSLYEMKFGYAHPEHS